MSAVTPGFPRHVFRHGKTSASGLMVLAAAFLVASFVGCATHADRVRTARELFYSGDVEAALTQLEKERDRKEADHDVIDLDLAMVQLFAGQPREAEQTLRAVRDHFDYLQQTDAGEVALSFLTDETRRAYAGEDYEKILVRVMLAYANLMSDGGDAEAYSLQVSTKQQEIIDAGVPFADENPKLAYKRVAAGAYLSGILSEATHSHYDDAERSLIRVVNWEPESALAKMALDRVRNGRHSAPGNGIVHIFAFVGRGPRKRQVLEVPTSQALLIADRILSATGEYSLPPTIAPIPIAQVVTSHGGPDALSVIVDQNNRGTTTTLTDVGQLATQQYNALYPHILARAVARRVIKKAAIYAAKDRLKSDNMIVNFAMDAAGVAWEAAEAADTRCWSLLPDRIQTARVELPAGKHRLTLQSAAGPSAASVISTAVDVEDGRNTYVLAYYADSGPIGRVLVSGQR